MYMGYTIIKTLKIPKQNISKQNPAVHFKKHASRPMRFMQESKWFSIQKPLKISNYIN